MADEAALPGFDPGPIDPSILFDQDSHRSEAIWRHAEGDDEDKIKIRSRRYDDIIHIDRDQQDDRVLQYLRDAGFLGLFRLGYMQLDMSLITALVERWRPETHTIHTTYGETTVTLQDIEMLSGVCVDGDPIVCPEYDTNWSLELLGKEVPRWAIKGSRVRIGWLYENFGEIAEDADDLTVVRHTRALIIMLLGGHYLSDKSGNRVSLQFLGLLRDFGTCSRMSWGSAILTNLYRQLCLASKTKVANISGALMILQLWAWTRFANISPVRQLASFPDDQVLPFYPYGYRWAAALHRYDTVVAGHSLKHYRDQFDMMRPEEINWEPYSDLVDNNRVAERTIWRARVPLICNAIVEHHYPDRVLRQFGMVQRIPNHIICNRDTLTELHKLDLRRTTWYERVQPYIQEWANWEQTIVASELVVGPMTLDDPYMDWYRRITRSSIRSPLHILGDGFRPAAPQIRALVEAVGAIFSRASRKGDDEIAQICRGVMSLCGLSNQLLTIHRPVRDPPRGGEGCSDRPSSSRGGTRRRTRDSEEIGRELDIPTFNLFPDSDPAVPPYIPQVDEDMPTYVHTPDFTADDHWRDALMETPGTYVLPYDMDYQRQRHDRFTTSSEVGQSSTGVNLPTSSGPSVRPPPPPQRPRRIIRQPICLTSLQRRRNQGN